MEEPGGKVKRENVPNQSSSSVSKTRTDGTLPDDDTTKNVGTSKMGMLHMFKDSMKRREEKRAADLEHDSLHESYEASALQHESEFSTEATGDSPGAKAFRKFVRNVFKHHNVSENIEQTDEMEQSNPNMFPPAPSTMPEASEHRSESSSDDTEDGSGVVTFRKFIQNYFRQRGTSEKLELLETTDAPSEPFPPASLISPEPDSEATGVKTFRKFIQNKFKQHNPSGENKEDEKLFSDHLGESTMTEASEQEADSNSEATFRKFMRSAFRPRTTSEKKEESELAERDDLNESFGAPELIRNEATGDDADVKTIRKMMSAFKQHITPVGKQKEERGDCTDLSMEHELNNRTKSLNAEASKHGSESSIETTEHRQRVKSFQKFMRNTFRQRNKSEDVDGTKEESHELSEPPSTMTELSEHGSRSSIETTDDGRTLNTLRKFMRNTFKHSNMSEKVDKRKEQSGQAEELLTSHVPASEAGENDSESRSESSEDEPRHKAFRKFLQNTFKHGNAPEKTDKKKEWPELSHSQEMFPSASSALTEGSEHGSGSSSDSTGEGPSVKTFQRFIRNAFKHRATPEKTATDERYKQQLITDVHSAGGDKMPLLAADSCCSNCHKLLQHIVDLESNIRTGQTDGPRHSLDLNPNQWVKMGARPKSTRDPKTSSFPFSTTTSTVNAAPSHTENKFDALMTMNSESDPEKKILIVGDSIITNVSSSMATTCCFPQATVSDVRQELQNLLKKHSTTSRIVIHVGKNDVLKEQSEELKKDFVDLLESLKRLNVESFISGPLPARGTSMFSRLLGLNTWLQKTCTLKDVNFIENFNLFWGKRQLFRQDGVHLNKLGVKVLTDNITFSLHHPSALCIHTKIHATNSRLSLLDRIPKRFRSLSPSQANAEESKLLRDSPSKNKSLESQSSKQQTLGIPKSQPRSPMSPPQKPSERMEKHSSIGSKLPQSFASPEIKKKKRPAPPPPSVPPFPRL